MIDLAWLALRVLSFVLTLQAAGMALYRLRFARDSAQVATVIAADTRRAALAAVIVVAAQIPLEPAYLAGELSAVLDRDTAGFALLSAGPELGVRLLGVVLLVLGGRPRAPPRTALPLAGSALAVLSFALAGHVPHGDYAALLVPLLLIHAGIVAWWFGALWPLYRVARLAEPRELTQLLTRFSRSAVWLVPLIPIAGVAIAAGLLSGVAALAHPYGLLLLAKGGMFLLALGLAAVNRQRLLPAIARGERTAVARLRGTLIGEYLLLCAALAATAIMSGVYFPG